MHPLCLSKRFMSLFQYFPFNFNNYVHDFCCILFCFPFFVLGSAQCNCLVAAIESTQLHCSPQHYISHFVNCTGRSWRSIHKKMSQSYRYFPYFCTSLLGTVEMGTVEINTQAEIGLQPQITFPSTRNNPIYCKNYNLPKRKCQTPKNRFSGVFSFFIFIKKMVCMIDLILQGSVLQMLSQR